ncbi:MAG: response regulator transcription factor [Candidatus Goldiibacteriota bacterium]
MDKKKILIVDDEPNIVYLTQMLLEDPHWEISSAGSGEECLEKIKKQGRPDLVLLDIMMPGKDGYEVCREIKSAPESKAATVVFYSALPADEVRRKMKETGADYYLEKSFAVDELKIKIKEIIEKTM